MMETVMRSKIKVKSIIVNFLLLGVLLTASPTSKADVVEFFATGAQGVGLLPGNIDPVTGSNGSGDIGESGLWFDTDTNILHVDIEWGSENGFSDLTGEIILLHLHGPTPSLAPDNFGEVNTDILVNLGNSFNFDSSATGGGLIDQFFLSNTEADYLLSGRTYINVHTDLYPAGEIRGYLLPVGSGIPEPASATLIGLIALMTCRYRRRG